ncbi:MAG: nucleotidyltransferase family protein [Lachnospiraceae bacterium]|nr:nucleotidyltransferase family protein [Lachnospiraceae bacterium]
MIVCGVIAEFNPFHNGHAYFIEQARHLTHADYLIIVMSGDYVQRGEPACMDKYCRTKAAVSVGADAVFELPVTVATGSAEYFARGAVAALDALGIVDYLCFGSESGDLEKLQELARNDFHSNHSRIQQSSSNDSIDKDLPNNILAVEYLRALNYFHSPMKPITFKRQGSGYHDTAAQEGTYCSATALRPLLRSLSNTSLPYASAVHYQTSQEKNKGELLHMLSRFVPECTLPMIKEYYNNHCFLDLNSVSDLLFYHFLMHPSEDLTDYFDIYGDLADKIQNALSRKRPASLLEFRNSLKTKDIAMTHINRALLHILLSIKKSDIELIKRYGYCACLRLLGFCKEASPLMNMIKTASKCPVITKLADAKNKLPEEQLSLLEKDIAASNLYQQLSLTNKETAVFPGEYRQPIIIASRS